MPRMHHTVLALLITLATATPGPSQTESVPTGEDAVAARYEKFIRDMSGATLIGSFTTTSPGESDDASPDQPVELKRERYEIKAVKKMDKEDFWIIEARIAYDDHDITVPVPVRIKWAAATPVITLDRVAIPGMGTFDARVLFHNGKYAGTWQHDAVGGHLFGDILPHADDSP